MKGHISIRVDIPDADGERLEKAIQKRGGIFGTRTFLCRKALEIFLDMEDGEQERAFSKLVNLTGRR